jgi:hypothetical protein
MVVPSLITILFSVKQAINPYNSKGRNNGKKENEKEAHQRFVDKERIESA